MKRPPLQGTALELPEPEPWDEPVDGTVLLDEIASTFLRFVILPVAVAYVLAIWVVHTHALDAFQVSPILALTSPEKRCGKSRVLEILEALARRAVLASSITSASLFRTVEKFHPTLLIDEADCYLGDDEALRGILNSGHSRRTARVIRTVGHDFEPRVFSTWGAKAIALIGSLPATLEDRAILVRMRRKSEKEEVERLRRDRFDLLMPLCRKAARWALDNMAALENADPKVPSGLSDRAADSWGPLLAIADLAGNDWPHRARSAALSLSSGADEGDNSVGVRLLTDLRVIFKEKAETILASIEITQALSAMEDSPWAEWKGGRQITPVQLARLLKRFDIGPRTVRRGDVTFKGYELHWFQDAFARYLPTEPSHPSQPGIDAAETAADDRHNESAVTGREGRENPQGINGVTGVTAEHHVGEPAYLALPDLLPQDFRAGPSVRRPSPETDLSLFGLTDEQRAALSAHGWEPMGTEPAEDFADA